ncbi:nucleoside-diphosphate sugar epimerase/dehydratase [Gaiella sp.]|uniref:polysaccharide biosynthesis protein n=1 Tax=Gaiella sp. TaxID=2663207 RepID=UPI002E308669|nr:nucleoside-diphosphate sugar epimerase/dehydratase [Gaiella sp.]HEX5585452.1 nucleoside-diphosphate sugar epimerase/dehydratase [Gaiella sp.]
MRSPVNRNSIWQVAVDGALVALAWWLAWNLRFDEVRPVYYDRYLDWSIVLLVVAIKLPVFALSGFYNRWWRYVSTRDMWAALRGVVLGSVAVFLVFSLFNIHRVAVPRGVWFIDLLLCAALIAGSRLLARTLIERPLPGRIVSRGKEVVVVGAGDAGQLVVKEMQRSPGLGYSPIGLIDDDPRKRNLRLHGVRVLGTLDDLDRVVRDRRPDEVLIAIPSASGQLRSRIVEISDKFAVPVKTLPSIAELVSGDADLARQLRPVQVEDVLGREPVEIDLDAVSGYLTGEVVLVTGAGGSIGSELCRQIARIRPAKLVLLDNAEPALFEIERELVRERGFLAAAAVVGDVKDAAKLRQVFDKYRPSVVFHAAAYKHVAMMEANPLEAVRNNTLGTRVLADVAIEHAAKRFVLVSTDKAANPRTVMGQSKALAEWIVEAWGNREGIETRFVAVRFGNVLGSSGSVIPIFRRQIARGGPVTVTHPEMTRFFMTIPEAVQLVVQAGAIGGRGQVYVLDMGEPVRIVDLAERMIRLSGKEPGAEIAIEFIGPAPGEKLREELVGAGELVSPSPYPKIDLITQPPVDAQWLEGELGRLERLVAEGDTLEVVGSLNRLVGSSRHPAAATSEPVG